MRGEPVAILGGNAVGFDRYNIPGRLYVIEREREEAARRRLVRSESRAQGLGAAEGEEGEVPPSLDVEMGSRYDIFEQVLNMYICVYMYIYIHIYIYIYVYIYVCIGLTSTPA